VTSHLPFLAWLMGDHARQVEAGRYPGDDGTIEIHAAAMDHLTETSRRHGVGVDVPELLTALLHRGIAAGHGDDGIASMIEVIKQPVAAR